MAKVKKSNLRDLALSAERSFRTKEIIIPEWDDADVIIREPSIKARMDHQALLDSAGDKELSAIEQRSSISRLMLFCSLMCFLIKIKSQCLKSVIVTWYLKLMVLSTLAY